MNDSRNTIEISDEGTLQKQPLVSVYMLAYRHERFIAEAIEGVIAQRCDFPIELIIGEDCSPDSTRTIALDYQRRYPHMIRVLTSESNVGARANACRCRAACRGKYIAICEGDDYWCDPSKLTRQVALIHDFEDRTMVCHRAIKINASGSGRSRRYQPSPFSRIFNTTEIILGDGGLIPTASILVRASLINHNAPWFRDAPVGDYALALRAASQGKVAYLNRVMSVYRTDVPHSWTQRHAPTLAVRLDYAQRIESMLNCFNEEQDRRWSAPVARTISKYYSDTIVRLQASRTDQRLVFEDIKDRLCASDLVLSWISVKTGIRLSLVKDVIRKSSTFGRLLKAYAYGERLREKGPPD